MNQQANTVEYEDELMDGVPEMEHIEQVLDGLSDTVMGTEGMDLTANQRYLQSVLHTAGYLTRNEVAGNEGFLSSIGEGIKKAWEYIKNLFKSIFGGLFKKKVKDRQEEVKVEIQKTEEVIKKAEQTPADKAANEKIMKALWARIDQIKQADAEKAKLKAEAEKIKTMPESSQPAAVKKLVSEVFEASLEDNAKLKQHAAQLKQAAENLTALKEEYAKTDDDSDMAGSIQTYLNGLIGLPGITSITNLETAKAFLAKLRRCQEAMSNSWMSIFNSQQAVQKKISEVSEKINHWTGDDKVNKELDAQIKELKQHLQGINRVGENTTKVTLAMSDIAVVLRKCIVTVE